MISSLMANRADRKVAMPSVSQASNREKILPVIQLVYQLFQALYRGKAFESGRFQHGVNCVRISLLPSPSSV